MYFTTPIKRGKVTWPYNPEKDHFGVDIGSEDISSTTKSIMREPVFAIESGQTLAYENTTNYGIYVDLFFDKEWGKSSSTRHLARYAHLDKAVVGARQYVKRGQLLGYVGNTGRSSGPHLHFEYHLPGIGLKPGDKGYKPWRHGIVPPLDYVPFVLNGVQINDLPETDWRILQGLNAIEGLKSEGIDIDSSYWESRLLESMPSHSQLEFMLRIIRLLKKEG